MKAINLTGQNPTARQELIDLLPLETPLVVQVFPLYACSFKCNYCIFQKPSKERHFISDKIKLTQSLYRKCLNDMKGFKDKIKVIRFVGIGEPLLHPDIGSMIYDTKRARVCNTIEIITNASNLTRNTSISLINCGINRLVVSIQGTSSEKYKQVSNVDINFDDLVKNIKFFYENKKDCHLYIKIVDTALDDKKDLQKFYDIFGDICDSIAVEVTVPIHSEVKLSESNRTQFGGEIKQVNTCPQSFYLMQINPDGKVVPCQSFEYPTILGDVNKENLVDIWKGSNLKKHRRSFLENNKTTVCSKCTMPIYRYFESDDLDDYTEVLKTIYE